MDLLPSSDSESDKSSPPPPLPPDPISPLLSTTRSRSRYEEGSSSSEDDYSSSEEDLQPVKKKRKRQYEKTKIILVQPTIFGLGGKYKITQSKVDKKTRKVISKFVRVENVFVGSDAGIFKVSCKYCRNGFLTVQGLGNHYLL